MKSFDRALEECLEWIKNGQTVEACLRRYPQYAGRLAPLLRTALELKEGARIQPTEAFRQRGRAELAAYMDSHPQESSRRLPHGPAYPPYSKAGSRRELDTFCVRGQISRGVRRPSRHRLRHIGLSIHRRI